MHILKVKVTQSCPTLCNPMDYTVHGILQARTLEWVAAPFSRGSSQPWSPTLQEDSLPAEPLGKPYVFLNLNKKTLVMHNYIFFSIRLRIVSNLYLN